MRNVRRNIVSTLLTLVAVLVVLIGAGRGDHVSDVRLIVGNAEQDIVRWQVTNFMDKWLHLAVRPFRGAPTAEQRSEAVSEFFQLGGDIRRLHGELERSVAATAAMLQHDPEALQQETDAKERRRAELGPVVLETLEAAITEVLKDLGIIDPFGLIRWPPVNFTFEPDSLVLVRSPRDAIVRLDDIPLRPDLNLLEREALEDRIEEDGETAALVIGVGGVATYPAQVTLDASLHTTLFLAAHEWLHHWMFFRSLGRQWWDGGEMTSINETVANIVGEEVGDQAYTLLTSKTVHREPWQPPALAPEPTPNVFDFRRELRQTRVHLETLLEAGAVQEAETYLEKRRREFTAHGWNIRKLNTAWFAFYGTYADSPASISPVEDQLRTLRADSASLAEFLERVAPLTRPGQLEALAREAGWRPAPGASPDG